MTDDEPLPYSVLIRIADNILEAGEDDPDALAAGLERLDPVIREELLASDLLNAFQVFYYFFREDPGDLETDRLILQPASALLTGVVVTGREFYEVIFRIEKGSPVILVSDGDSVLAGFHEKDAYRQALRFIDEQL
ncbi:MAG: hypothetical protein GKC06_01280 [Methanomicrobiales archaeon]|nr:hypothetical protein [Methanomicrobiales archaeon]